MADVKRNDVATQLNRIVSIANSLPIDGNAILMDELIKGMRNDPMVVTSNTDLLSILIIDVSNGKVGIKLIGFTPLCNS